MQKDNVALVVVLEALQRAATQKDHQSRICVANTHIFANTKYPDVKLYLVVNLIQGLQKIVETKVPLLICADLNSAPRSDPHRFLVRGKNDSTYEKKETDPLGIHRIMRLHHPLPLESGKMSSNAARQPASDYNIGLFEQRPRDSVAPLSLEEPTPETAAVPVTSFISNQHGSNGTDPPSGSENDNRKRRESLVWDFLIVIGVCLAGLIVLIDRLQNRKHTSPSVGLLLKVAYCADSVGFFLGLLGFLLCIKSRTSPRVLLFPTFVVLGTGFGAMFLADMLFIWMPDD